MPYQYNILYTISGPPDDIWNYERSMLRKLKEFKYSPKLKFKGETECFTPSCLEHIKYEL